MEKIHQVWHTLEIKKGDAITLNNKSSYSLDDKAFRATKRAEAIKAGDVVVFEIDISHLPGNFPSSFHVVQIISCQRDRIFYERSHQFFFIDLTRPGHIVRRSDYLATLSI